MTMQPGKKIRNWDTFLRSLDDDPIQTIITHTTHTPPIFHIICTRRGWDLTRAQVRRLHQLGRLPDAIVAFLVIRGVLPALAPEATAPDSTENAGSINDSPPE